MYEFDCFKCKFESSFACMLDELEGKCMFMQCKNGIMLSFTICVRAKHFIAVILLILAICGAMMFLKTKIQVNLAVCNFRKDLHLAEEFYHCFACACAFAFALYV